MGVQELFGLTRTAEAGSVALLALALGAAALVFAVGYLRRRK